MGKARKVNDTRQKSGTLDGGVYIVVLAIGLFGIWMWYLADLGPWTHALIGYVMAVVVLINLNGWRVYHGKHLAGWQQSLARLVLRWAGYGTKGGKPLEASHGSEKAKMMLMVSFAASALLVAGLTWLLLEQ